MKARKAIALTIAAANTKKANCRSLMDRRSEIHPTSHPAKIPSGIVKMMLHGAKFDGLLWKNPPKKPHSAPTRPSSRIAAAYRASRFSRGDMRAYPIRKTRQGPNSATALKARRPVLAFGYRSMILAGFRNSNASGVLRFEHSTSDSSFSLRISHRCCLHPPNLLLSPARSSFKNPAAMDMGRKARDGKDRNTPSAKRLRRVGDRHGALIRHPATAKQPSARRVRPVGFALPMPPNRERACRSSSS